MHSTIAHMVQSITAHDDLEQEHIATTLAWINAGSPLFRMTKPDIPAQHLVSYFVLVDTTQHKVLLVDHKKAGLWLPSGGHVEPDEHPTATVRRESIEELGIPASFLLPEPIFVTVTQTVGITAGHTDVSLWYVLHGDCSQGLTFDPAEFHTIQWFALDQVPAERTDPHMQRFLAKLKAL